MRAASLAVAITLALISPLAAQSYSSSGSTSVVGNQACTTLMQTGSNAANARIAADDNDIPQPKSVKTFTCLDKFFRGTGLNVVANLLNPDTLLSAVENAICNKLTSVWASTIGKAQCGISLSGLKMGLFGGSSLGGGLSCPKLSIGGGGPTLMQIGVGSSGGGSLYMTGNAVTPTGYPLTSKLGLY